MSGWQASIRAWSTLPEPRPGRWPWVWPDWHMLPSPVGGRVEAEPAAAPWWRKRQNPTRRWTRLLRPCKICPSLYRLLSRVDSGALDSITGLQWAYASILCEGQSLGYRAATTEDFQSLLSDAGLAGWGTLDGLLADQHSALVSAIDGSTPGARACNARWAPSGATTWSSPRPG